MIYNRYYYSTLNDVQKVAYKTIYAAFERFEKEIFLNNGMLPIEDILGIVYAIDLDNPHLFYIDFGNIKIKTMLGMIVVTVTYLYNQNEVAQIQPKIQKATNAILKRVHGTTVYEKVLSLHDILAENILYDDNAAEAIDKYYLKSNTILGVLFFKTAVCEGISKTFKLLLNMLDIKCLVVIGDTDENTDKNIKHAWNIVKIDGSSYHVDLTWDVNRSFPNAISHAYFCISDSEAMEKHSWKSNEVPACEHSKSYYKENDLIAHNDYDMCRIIDRACFQGKTSIEIQTDSEKSFEEYADLCMRTIKHHTRTKAAVEIGKDATNKIVLFRWALHGESFPIKPQGKNIVLAYNNKTDVGLFKSIKDFFEKLIN
ncbi:MAG: transglutaminase domain-containing protein [Paludibacteraceae bacterium]